MIRSARSMMAGVVFCFVVLSAAYAQSPIEFAAGTTVSFPHQSATIADMLGTPHPEAVFSDGISITIVTIQGVVIPVIQSGYVMPLPASFTRVADLDGDGDNDIVVHAVGPNSTAFFYVIRRNASGSTTSTIATTSSATYTESVSLTDVNSDGKIDIVTAKQIFINQGNASFTAPPIPLAPGYDYCSTGDIDGDGDIDVVKWNCGPNMSTLQIERNLGGGNFTALAPLSLFSASVGTSIRVRDMNGDGRDDVVAAWSNASNRVQILTYLGTTATTLTAQPAYEIAGAIYLPDQISLADLDADGDADLAVRIHAYTNSPGAPTAAALREVTILLTNTGGALTDRPGHGTAFFGPTTGALEAENTLIDMDLDGVVDCVQHAVPIHIFNTNYLPIVTYRGIAATGALPTWTQSPLTTTPIVIEPNATYTDAFTLTYSGAPARGHTATITLSGSASPTNPLPSRVACNHLDVAEFAINAGPQAGLVNVTLTTPEGISQQSTFIVRPDLIVVSGDLQNVCLANPFPQPLVVRAVDSSGAGVAGIPVTFSQTSVPVTLSASTVTTDVNGYAAVTATPLGAGSITISARVGTSAAQTFFTESAIPGGFTSLVSGPGPTLNFGEASSAPYVIYAEDCNGNPAAGITLNVTGQPSGRVVMSSPTVVTNAQGIAQFSVAQVLTGGAVTIRAQVAGFLPTDIPLDVRRLSSIVGNTTTILFYQCAHANIPLILAADFPLPAPGYIPTIIGPVHTSILSPGPNFGVFDGMGLFGSIDPGMFTSFGGAWVRPVATPSVPLGLTFVLEMYGYDLAYPGLDGYFISNTILFSL